MYHDPSYCDLPKALPIRTCSRTLFQLLIYMSDLCIHGFLGTGCLALDAQIWASGWLVAGFWFILVPSFPFLLSFFSFLQL